MKKNVLFLSIILVASSLVAVFSRQIGIGPSYSYSDCADFFDTLFMIIFPAIPLFIFSLITYPMKENVFQAWWQFTRVWIPISMLAILIAPSYSHNWMFPIEKGTVASFSSLIYIITNILIIFSRYYALKKGYSYSVGVLFSVFIISFIIAVFIFISLARML
ncbi:MAG TPA: hypothetical protein DEA46_00385 [Candidatus Moranbacteria bacterium]|nr:hypothetical protein [Candidatus Moranbacteria bacterium]